MMPRAGRYRSPSTSASARNIAQAALPKLMTQMTLNAARSTFSVPKWSTLPWRVSLRSNRRGTATSSSVAKKISRASSFSGRLWASETMNQMKRLPVSSFLVGQTFLSVSGPNGPPSLSQRGPKHRSRATGHRLHRPDSVFARFHFVHALEREHQLDQVFHRVGRSLLDDGAHGVGHRRVEHHRPHLHPPPLPFLTSGAQRGIGCPAPLRLLRFYLPDFRVHQIRRPPPLEHRH